jgi:hypothetical protein
MADPTPPTPEAGRAGPTPTPDVEIDARSLYDREAAKLAGEFQATTLAALAAVRVAAVDDTLAAHMDAGRGLLAAHRPAAAARHLARARELAGDRPPAELEVMTRQAAQAATLAARPRARSGTVFVQTLVEVLQEHERDRALSSDALTVVNETARRLGSGHVLELVPRGEWLHARLGVAQGDKAARTVDQPDDGYPCERCGAPRWTFTHDDDLGEFCSSCAWPLSDVEALAATRIRRTNRELSEQVKALQAEVADRDRRLAAAAAEKLQLEAKIDKLKRPAQIMSRPGRARVNLGGALGQPRVSSAIPADATLEQIQQVAAAAVETCAASKAIVDECAVRARELEAQRGSGA